MSNGALSEAWLFLRSLTHRVAVPASHVRRLLPLTALNVPPGQHAVLRGVADVGGVLVPAIDLRKLLDGGSGTKRVETLADSLRARRADHVRWLQELEASVRERRPFALATDPHKCAFGRWYDAFRADDALLAIKLLAFAAPHEQIHALAAEVLTLAEADPGAALARIEAAQAQQLAVLLQLFDQTITMVERASSEILVVCATGRAQLGLIADEATSLAPLERQPTSGTEVGIELSSWSRGIAHQAGLAALLLDVDRLGAIIA